MRRIAQAGLLVVICGLGLLTGISPSFAQGFFPIGVYSSMSDTSRFGQVDSCGFNVVRAGRHFYDLDDALDAADGYQIKLVVNRAEYGRGVSQNDPVRIEYYSTGKERDRP